jgi:hypothetical protein
MPKINSDDLEHDVAEMDFEAPNEQWQEYKLADGTKIKFRGFIVSILKSDKFNEMGQPYYFINSQTQIRTYAPPKNCGPPSKPLKINIQDKKAENIHGYR